MDTPYRMLPQRVAAVSGSLSPNLVLFSKSRFRPVVWKKSRPVRRVRSFRYVILFLLFATCLCGISVTAAAGYALLTIIR